MKDYFSEFFLSTYDDLLSYGSTNRSDSQYIVPLTLWTISKIVCLQPPTKEKCELSLQCKVNTLGVFEKICLSVRIRNNASRKQWSKNDGGGL